MPTSGPPATAMTAVTGAHGDVVKEVLALIQDDRADKDAIAKRRRNSTPAVMQADRAAVTQKGHGSSFQSGWTDSSEAAAINEAIKEARARRMSKEAIQPVSERGHAKKNKGDATTKSPVKLSPEAAEINRRIAEDRRVRRASKELEDAEKAALKRAEEKLLSMGSEVRRVEAEAEEMALAHDGNVADARARGAAKAAATRAGGVFHTKGEWQAVQNAHKAEVASLEQKVAALTEELRAARADRNDDESSHRGSLFGQLTSSFKRPQSPGLRRQVSSSSFVAGSPPGLRRQASSSSFGASSFKKLFIKRSLGTASGPSKVAFMQTTDVLSTDRGDGDDALPTPSGGTVPEPPHMR